MKRVNTVPNNFVQANPVLAIPLALSQAPGAPDDNRWAKGDGYILRTHPFPQARSVFTSSISKKEFSAIATFTFSTPVL